MSQMLRFSKQISGSGTRWMFVTLVILSLVLIALIALIAWSPTDQRPPQPFFDDLGRLVAINETPRRIISLAPSITEILFALGLRDQVVGVTDWCDYPPEALGKRKVGGLINPNIEKIVALNPDLVLVAHGLPREVISNMERLGLTVFGIRTTHLDDLLNDIRRIAEITDTEIKAQALTSEMASSIQRINNVTSKLPNRPRVFYIIWHDSLWTAGSGTFIHELIHKAGGANIAHNITGYAIITLEEVVARNPEIIITSRLSYEWARNATKLAGTNARKTGRIFTLDDDLVQRPGPRLVKGLDWFAHFIHPDIFGKPSSS